MTKTYATPGVYVNEVSAFPPAIQAAPTGMTLFLGDFSDGRDWPEQDVEVGSLADVLAHYGPWIEGDALLVALWRYFDEGGAVARLARYHPAAGFDAAGLETRIDASAAFDLIVTAPPALIDDWAALLVFADGRQAMLLLDGPLDGGLLEVPEMDEALLQCGALYSPWLLRDAVSEPPSAAVAAVVARTDASIGVWKAPAGSHATIKAHVTVALTDDMQGQMNAEGQNGIRRFNQFGTVVWGARTLAGRDAANSDYQYIPVKRMTQMLTRTLRDALQFAVFEPNDERLWASLRAMVSSFLMTYWAQGAFCGNSAKEAFFVMCDATTTTPVDVDAGMVNLIIGFAPIKPAEFVVLNFSAPAGQRAG